MISIDVSLCNNDLLQYILHILLEEELIDERLVQDSVYISPLIYEKLACSDLEDTIYSLNRISKMKVSVIQLLTNLTLTKKIKLVGSHPELEYVKKILRNNIST